MPHGTHKRRASQKKEIYALELHGSMEAVRGLQGKHSQINKQKTSHYKPQCFALRRVESGKWYMYIYIYIHIYIYIDVYTLAGWLECYVS